MHGFIRFSYLGSMSGTIRFSYLRSYGVSLDLVFIATKFNATNYVSASKILFLLTANFLGLASVEQSYA